MTTRVLFFGTHPKQFNGYSKVVYELAKCMCKSPDIDLTIFGFQNFYQNEAHRTDLPSNLAIHDAFAHEEPKESGFGFNQVKEFVKLNKPDVCIVYNDMLVLSQIVNQLRAVEGHTYKIIGYVDQVYLNQKKEFIDYINKNLDMAMCFTDEWEKCLKKQGVTIPTSYLPHGFNKMAYFPIPKVLARQYYGLKSEDFIILNLNRNQPRKRWDVCLKAFAEIVSRYPKEPIKLMIATAVQGAWNLLEIFERELMKRGVTLEEGIKHLIIIDNPQKITDEQTNILYNIADIGINTCDGEGFGLCNFEQAALGIPQLVPRLGGFVDYLDDTSAYLVEPKFAYYVDNTRDLVCGEALLCDYNDFVEGIEAYYNNREMLKRHGEVGRASILEKYPWEKVTDKLISIVHATLAPAVVVPTTVAPVREVAAVNNDLCEQVEKIDIDSLKSTAVKQVKEKEAKKKLPKKEQKKLDKKIKKLQAQLDKLVSDKCA